MTEREQFTIVCFNGSLLVPDAIVVLMGEDAAPRLAVAREAYRGSITGTYTPAIVVTGGRHEAPRWMGAEKGAALLLGQGIAPDRIIVEPTAKHTYEQAEQALELATLNEWRRLIVIASAYHVPRAMLTFVQALHDRDLHETIQVTPLPASQSAWWEAPEGMTATRLELLQSEWDKVQQYRQRGHVAPYALGMEYFAYWEAHQ